MAVCMRRACVWASRLDGKCHLPCMAGAGVLSDEAVLRNRLLCKRFHSRLRELRREAAAGGAAGDGTPEGVPCPDAGPAGPEDIVPVSGLPGAGAAGDGTPEGVPCPDAGPAGPEQSPRRERVPHVWETEDRT